LAAELDGRLSDLEALVQELSVVKGDQAGLQELRVLLADTATQVGGTTRKLSLTGFCCRLCCSQLGVILKQQVRYPQHAYATYSA
jgi:hypothetical protein